MKVRSIFCLSFLLGLFVPTLLFAVEADQTVVMNVVGRTELEEEANEKVVEEYINEILDRVI